MGAGKFCLGYPSRTAAALAFRAQGMDRPAIARKIGVTTSTVTGLLISADRVRDREPRAATAASRSTSGAVAEMFPAHQVELMRRHAAKRDMTLARFVQELVGHAIKDELVDAILDDGVSGERA